MAVVFNARILLLILTLVVIVATLSFLVNSSPSMVICVPPAESSTIPRRLLSCTSDCTSKELECVDWDGFVCRELDALSGCCPTKLDTRGKPCDSTPCCFSSYATCVSACRINSSIDPTLLPGPSFDACRDECRLTTESWYRDRQRKGSSGTVSPAGETPLYCYGRVPWPPRPFADTSPIPRPMPTEPLTRPWTPPPPMIWTDPKEPNETVKIIEFH